MKIIFLLPAGICEWEVPPDPPVTFNQIATQIRMTGYFMAENLYIRHEAMLGMALAGEGQPTFKPPGTVMQ